MNGDQLATQLLQGQVDGGSIATAVFDMMPALPAEGPPFMPRALARRLFPQGFLGAQAVIPPLAPPVAPPPPPAAVVAREPRVTAAAPPPPPARPGHRPPVSEAGGEVRAVRIFQAERKGM